MSIEAFTPAYATSRITVAATAGTPLQVMNDSKLPAGLLVAYRICNVSSAATLVAWASSSAAISAIALPAAGSATPASNYLMLQPNEAKTIQAPANSFFNTIGVGTGDLYVTPGGGV